MLPGFVIWSLVSLLILGVGICAWRSETPAGFYSGVKPPEVRDTRKYNRAVARLWFAFAAAFELIGLPLLFLKQNSAGFLPSLLGTPILVIALVVAYNRILERHRKK